MDIEKKFLDYNLILKKNLLNVVKYALNQASDYGLSDGHHFYITFNTEYKNNSLPSYLIEEYPENMTIVLENEFWDLKIENEYFLVSLKFRGKIEKLKIMLDSLISFVDPSVSFKLNLNIDKENSNDSKKENSITKKNTGKIKEININQEKDNVIVFKPNKK